MRIYCKELLVWGYNLIKGCVCWRVVYVERGFRELGCFELCCERGVSIEGEICWRILGVERCFGKRYCLFDLVVGIFMRWDCKSG